ncbi:hypothetical protein RDABS01_028542 [Bienertia sinuspersici]
MVSANKEMAVYCFDTLVAHYNSDQVPPPAFEEGEQRWLMEASLAFVGCIGTLEARALINGFRDYALY